MNIIEAMEWVKKGYYIRRSLWKKDLLLSPVFYDFGQELGCASGHGWETFGLGVFNITANDWEVGPKWPQDVIKEYPKEKIAEWEKEQSRFNKWQEENAEYR